MNFELNAMFSLYALLLLSCFIFLHNWTWNIWRMWSIFLEGNFLYIYFSKMYIPLTEVCVPYQFVLSSLTGKTFQLYSHNLIALFEQAKKTGLAAHIQTHRFPDKILPRYKSFTYNYYQVTFFLNAVELVAWKALGISCWCIFIPVIPGSLP